MKIHTRNRRTSGGMGVIRAINHPTGVGTWLGFTVGGVESGVNIDLIISDDELLAMLRARLEHPGGKIYHPFSGESGIDWEWMSDPRLHPGFSRKKSA